MSQSEEQELWDPALRRKIRNEQRSIITQIHSKQKEVGFVFHFIAHVLTENREDMKLPDQLLKDVRSLDKLMDNVVATKEAAIDAEGFRLLSAIGREQVEQTHGSLVQFEASTYAEKLVAYMGGRRGVSAGKEGIGRLNWVQLGDRAARAFNRPPVTNFL